MKQEYRYAIYLVGALLLLVLVEYFTPEPINWAFTLEKRDKSPYGTYVLGALLKDVFPGQTIEPSQNSLFDLKDENLTEANLLIIATAFDPDSVDAAVLLQQVDQGSTALVAASFYRGYLADTLRLDFDTRLLPTLTELSDTLPRQTYDQTYFTAYDSARTTVLARDGDNHPVLLQMRFGAGALLLSSVPYQFTNYHLLRENGADATARTLSYLPVRGRLLDRVLPNGSTRSHYAPALRAASTGAALGFVPHPGGAAVVYGAGSEAEAARHSGGAASGQHHAGVCGHGEQPVPAHARP